LGQQKWTHVQLWRASRSFIQRTTVFPKRLHCAWVHFYACLFSKLITRYLETYLCSNHTVICVSYVSDTDHHPNGLVMVLLTFCSPRRAKCPLQTSQNFLGVRSQSIAETDNLKRTVNWAEKLYLLNPFSCVYFATLWWISKNVGPSWCISTWDHVVF